MTTRPITPPEARKLWVEALRSGEYEQGRLALRDNGRYCCLGVACDLYHKHTGQGSWDGDDFGGEECHAPPPVMEWLGLADRAGKHGDNRYLTNMNDNRVDFLSIASLIESNPPGLFVEEAP